MKIDKRKKFYKTIKRYCNRETLCAGILGILAGIVLSKSLYDASHPRIKSPQPLGQAIVKQVEASTTPLCYDVITCIRDVGESLGFSNKDIMIAINISRAESGFRSDAINKNSNGTFDIGAFQINDVHSKRISRTDRMDFEKNIRFAYKLRQEQGNWNAWSVCKFNKVNCN